MMVSLRNNIADKFSTSLLFELFLLSLSITKSMDDMCRYDVCYTGM